MVLESVVSLNLGVYEKPIWMETIKKRWSTDYFDKFESDQTSSAIQTP